jgi:hypothetical protein
MSKNKKSDTSTAIVLREIQLSPRANEVIRTITPQEFVKERKGKGGKTFTYVETGYVISQLNKAFTPVGWQFEVLEEKVMTNEVYVKGKLTIKDYKTGYEVFKTQYGTKEIYANNKTPIGDLLKSASSDCLKKCASLLGLALDIYWQATDEGQPEEKPQIKVIETTNQDKIYDMALKGIAKEESPITLNEIRKKLNESKLYSDRHKKALTTLIDEKIKRIVG